MSGIPKKPEEIIHRKYNGEEIFSWRCPNCHVKYMTRGYELNDFLTHESRCNYCGQKIDWSEVEGE